MQLEIKNVSRVYPASGRAKAVTALEETSFGVEDGELVCLLGPSGCGKSTLLFMLAGLDMPSSGEIRLDGVSIHGPGKERGLVFQNYTLYPWLTVRENAGFAERLYSNQKDVWSGSAPLIHERVDYLLNVMGLEKFRDAYPRELSGGMKQRVAIARTLVNRPRVMLMDEPFGALDSQTREEMQELLLLLSANERTTVIFVTHDVDEAIFLGTRVLVFSKRPGRILEDIRIPFPKNADFSIKMDQEFLRIKRHLLDLLRSQSEGSGDRNEILARLVAQGKRV